MSLSLRRFLRVITLLSSFWGGHVATYLQQPHLVRKDPAYLLWSALDPRHPAKPEVLPSGDLDSPYISNTKAYLPLLIPTEEEQELQEKVAIEQLLRESGSPAVEWPANAPKLLATPISPQFRFTAKIDKSVGDGPGITYHIASVYSGQPSKSEPHLVEFLHMYITSEDAASLRASLEQILMEVWAKTALREYKKTGGQLRRARKKVSKRAKSSKKASRAKEEGTDHNEEENDPDDSQGQKERQKSLLRSGGETPGEGFKDALDVMGAFLQKREKRRFPRRGTRRLKKLAWPQYAPAPLRSLYVFYTGALYISCWHSVASSESTGEAKGLSLEADNRIVFVVKPRSFKFVREDGMAVTARAHGKSIALTFLGKKGLGLARLRDGVMEQFRINMIRRHPNPSRVIFRTLFDAFALGEDKKCLERNTCPLGSYALDAMLAEYARDRSHALYASSRPDVVNKVTLTLSGEELTESVSHHLLKCLGRVMPSAVMVWTPQKSLKKHRFGCVDTARSNRFEYVDLGPTLTTGASRPRAG